MGFKGGFIEQCPLFTEFPTRLKCYTLNDTTWYPNYGDPCDLEMKIPELNKADEVKIFLNSMFSFQSILNMYPNCELTKYHFIICRAEIFS
ncbi:MAG: hypothetical protein BWX51_01835 [Bacteroidetes bacterium ADurb.Bin012]|jgi:hypothetical protein|nr:MAG: hypothetical protein BWX51_01835 [Bacteroidetes bacterium ADurb.Bin012]